MKKMLVTIGIGLATFASAGAHADPHSSYYSPSYGNGLYFGASIGELAYKEEGLDTMHPTIVEARLGQNINPYLAIEGRLGGGLGSDSTNGFTTSVQLIYAGYIKGILPFSPIFSGYGLAGIAGAQFHRNYPDFDTSATGFSYGVGAELKVAPTTSVTLEWARLTDGTNFGYYFTADQLTLGFNWHF